MAGSLTSSWYLRLSLTAVTVAPIMAQTPPAVRMVGAFRTRKSDVIPMPLVRVTGSDMVCPFVRI